MAFQSASGYNNLPNGVFSPTIFSKKVQKQFRKSAVSAGITNSDYFGEISGYGDSVKIIKEPEIAVNSYARGGRVQAQDLEDSEFSLIVDRANSFAFRVDDIETLQSHVNWEDLAKDRATYKLVDKYDQDILGYMAGYEWNDSTGEWAARTTSVGIKAESTADNDELLAAHKLGRDAFVSGGANTDSIVIGTSGTYDATPLKILARMSRILDQKNVDKENRWVVVDPVFMEVLMDEDSKFMDRDYQGSEQLSNGKLSAAKVRGFSIYLSNNLPYLGTGPDTADSNGSNANFGVVLAGHMSAAATAEQLKKTEKLRDNDSFGDIVRGLHLYGRKILRPEGLVTARYNIN